MPPADGKTQRGQTEGRRGKNFPGAEKPVYEYRWNPLFHPEGCLEILGEALPQGIGFIPK